jgi:hypothetical protein
MLKGIIGPESYNEIEKVCIMENNAMWSIGSAPSSGGTFHFPYSWSRYPSETSVYFQAKRGIVSQKISS